MNNKEKIIKSGAFLVATTIVLVVVTVAWFISGGNKATVEGISADIENDGFTYVLYEAEDTNKNGILDEVPEVVGETPENENWLPVSEQDIVIGNMVPNQYRYFKAVIQTGTRTVIKVKFSGIEITDPALPLTQEAFLNLIHVRFRTEDATGQSVTEPGGDAFNKNMYEILGTPVQNELDVYTIDLTSFSSGTFNVYYTIGVYGDSFTGTENFTGARIDIDRVIFE